MPVGAPTRVALPTNGVRRRLAGWAVRVADIGALPLPEFSKRRARLARKGDLQGSDHFLFAEFARSRHQGKYSVPT